MAPRTSWNTSLYSRNSAIINVKKSQNYYYYYYRLQNTNNINILGYAHSIKYLNMTICYCRKSAMHSSRVRVCWTLDLTVPVAVAVVIHSDFHQPLCCSKSGVSTPSSLLVCLQCSDAGWAAGRASGL